MVLITGQLKIGVAERNVCRAFIHIKDEFCSLVIQIKICGSCRQKKNVAVQKELTFLAEMSAKIVSFFLDDTP